MIHFVALFAIFGAKYLFVASFIIAGIYFLKADRDLKKKIMVFSAITFPSILLVASLAGQVYENPRPFVVEQFTPLIPHTADNGFPSDHVLLVSAIAAVFSFFNRRLGVELWFIASLVAFSRVYVGVHHPVDVLGSMLISIFVTFIVYATIKKKFPFFFNNKKQN